MSNEQLKSRIKQLSKAHDSSKSGKCVLYVMSRDQRVADNHALLVAQKHALAKGLPLAVVFCLYEKSGYRKREHYQFMVQGLREVEKKLSELCIPFMMLIGNPREKLAATFAHLDPDAVYFDMNPLRGPRKLQSDVAADAEFPVYCVDTHNVVPVWIASDKKEIGARTHRTKIHKKFEEYLQESEPIVEHPTEWPGDVKSMDDLSSMIQEVLENITSCGIDVKHTPGESAALTHLDNFVDNSLADYADKRNDPANDALSDMSPYLHFGHIASLRVAIKMLHVVNGSGATLHLLESNKMPKPEDSATNKIASANALLEEMIVRKELSDNFCYYEAHYQSLSSADNWAQQTIKQHVSDGREHTYTLDELEQAKTHDRAWNAAQKQLTTTGKMHGYMRMYWAKKVLEWSPKRSDLSGGLDSFSSKNDMDGMKNTAARTFSDEETANTTQLIESKLIEKLKGLHSFEWALEVLIYLNDTYSIDGCDPNGYVGILWSIAGVHDRPWTEREVFGKVRYMNYSGLKRKFDIETYEQTWL